MTPAELKPGVRLHVGKEASVQFTSPIRFRLARVRDDLFRAGTGTPGMVWLEGCEIDRFGHEVEDRLIYVRVAELRALRQEAPR